MILGIEIELIECLWKLRIQIQFVMHFQSLINQIHSIMNQNQSPQQIY